MTLRAVQRGAYADVALERTLQRQTLESRDRGLLTELVYGCVRRQRTLNALIDQFIRKPNPQIPPDLRTILQLGFYQLRYLSQVPPSAAVNTTVDLSRNNQLTGLAGLVNGVLRAYLRQSEAGDPLELPAEPMARLGILHSFPDWIVTLWLEQLGEPATAQLCEWLNRPPTIDLRINPQQTDLETVATAFEAAGIATSRIVAGTSFLPQALRLEASVGTIPELPGFAQGWWSVQDASAQLVAHLLNPQPGETIIDACAAPGGKTTHIAELLQDQGKVWACDRTPSRLKKLQQNLERLNLHCIQIATLDSSTAYQFRGMANRVLVDAPCSGLGTLHRHADARWRQTPDTVADLAQQQQRLLANTATWVKPGGTLVYATCTLHPQENEAVVQAFLQQHPTWQILPPAAESPLASLALPEGWIKVWPHRHQMDGFFMVQLAAP